MDKYGNFILEDYKLCDEDINTNIKYYGYRDRDGNFFILKYNVSAGTYRYFRGISENYASSWAGRAGLTYSYYNEVF